MKIESVIENSRYTNPNRYSFVAKDGSPEIPTGAKVTVEWDKNVHRCEELEGTSITLIWSGRFDPWGLTQKGSKYIERIQYCPGCGEKLP